LCHVCLFRQGFQLPFSNSQYAGARSDIRFPLIHVLTRFGDTSSGKKHENSGCLEVARLDIVYDSYLINMPRRNSHLEGTCQAKKYSIEKFFDFSLFMSCRQPYQCRFFIGK
jgi:hypothetical protein